MGIKDRFERWWFITQTRWRVAYANFTAERAFDRRPAPLRLFPPKVAAALAGIALIAGVGVSLVSHAPDQPAAPAVSMPAVANASLPDASRTILPADGPEYAVAVDKVNRVLLILKNEGEYFAVVRRFGISLGKMVGAKQREGDMRTPVGFYHITEIKDGRLLPSIYGPRVFVTNYPNSFDVAMGRTGGGIWLHGSGLGDRTPDTRGCVELDDNNVKMLEQWVHVNTPVAIYPDDFPLPVVNGRLEKKYLSMEFFYGNSAPALASSAG